MRKLRFVILCSVALIAILLLHSCASGPPKTDLAKSPSPPGPSLGHTPLPDPAASELPTSVTKEQIGKQLQANQKATKTSGHWELSEQKLAKTIEKSIDEAIEELSKGELQYFVPQKMKVDVSSTIESAIAPEINRKLLDKVASKTAPVQYSVSGTEMRLITQKEDFEVTKVHPEDIQSITSKKPGKWRWRVKPLRSGKKTITIQAIAHVKILALNKTESYPITTYDREVPVQINWPYSFKQFLLNNWKEVIGLVVGSGSLASGLTWWVGQCKKKEQPVEQGEKIEDFSDSV
jgi:hypothetical protein